MMLKLEVISYKGVAPTRAISAALDKVAGTIGRGDANALVLPDAERIISRMHARIEYRSGRYLLEDHGSSTPVIVNGRSLGKGADAVLAHGDDIKIGDYRLRVALEGEADASVTSLSFGAAAVNAKDDPLALFGAGGGSNDPFADLATPGKPPAKSTQAPSSPVMADPFAPRTPTQSSSGIPDDFDPFANLGTPSAVPPGKSAAADPSGLNLGGPLENKGLDTMFGLGTPSARDPLAQSGPIPTPTRSLGPLGSKPSLDPLAPFQSQPARAPAPAQRNDVPELHGSFVPPKPIPDDVFVDPAASPQRLVAAASAVSELAASPVVPTPPALPEAPPPPPASAMPLAASPAAQPADGLLETQRFKRENVAQEATVRAFLDGAGIADLNLPAGMTPQTMYMLGQVLRETVQAMLDLLLARSMLKRELRADVTMIDVRENNPLKFSPNVDAALSHLLAPQRGFMLPLEAVKDACNDLRSHQFAFMAGMRAALADVLHRFDPQQIEQRLKHKSMLDSILPANRKAKMWELFTDLYGDMSKEAEEDFHALFGREFVRAYEAQIRRLAQQDSPTAGR